MNFMTKRLAQFGIAGLTALMLIGCSGSSDSGTETAAATTTTTTTTTTTATNSLEKYAGTYSITAYTTDPVDSTKYQKGKMTVKSDGLATASIDTYPTTKGTAKVVRDATSGSITGITISMSYKYATGIYTGQTYVVKGTILPNSAEVKNGTHTLGPNKSLKWTATKD